MMPVAFSVALCFWSTIARGPGSVSSAVISAVIVIRPRAVVFISAAFSGAVTFAAVFTGCALPESAHVILSYHAREANDVILPKQYTTSRKGSHDTSATTIVGHQPTSPAGH